MSGMIKGTRRRWAETGVGVAAARHWFAPLATQPREIAAFVYLDPDRMLLGMRHTPSRESGSVDVPVRAVVTDALAFGATHIVMAHNHPSGDVRPSAADLVVTRRLAAALQVMELLLIDHFILGGCAVSSLRELGLL